MDEVVFVFTLNILTKFVDWPLGATIFVIYTSKYDRSIEGGPLCQLRCRLVVAAGGSLRFGCQHPAPPGIRSRGHPFRIAAVNRKILVRSIRAKRTRFETFGG